MFWPSGRMQVSLRSPREEDHDNSNLGRYEPSNRCTGAQERSSDAFGQADDCGPAESVELSASLGVYWITADDCAIGLVFDLGLGPHFDERDIVHGCICGNGARHNGRFPPIFHPRCIQGQAVVAPDNGRGWFDGGARFGFAVGHRASPAPPRSSSAW